MNPRPRDAMSGKKKRKPKYHRDPMASLILLGRATMGSANDAGRQAVVRTMFDRLRGGEGEPADFDKVCIATLCTDREDAEKEAKDANMAWPHTAPHRAVQLVEVDSIGVDAVTKWVNQPDNAEAKGPRSGPA